MLAASLCRESESSSLAGKPFLHLISYYTLICSFTGSIHEFFSTTPHQRTSIFKFKDKKKGYTKMTDSISSQQGSEPNCDQVVINIEDMFLTAPNLLPSRDGCIRKVPVNLRHKNGAAYTPQIISIGPLHHDNKKLQPMQAYKIGFLYTLLGREPGTKLGDVVEFLSGLEKRVRSSYFIGEFACKISSNDFVQMMLLDGCFIVELFLKELFLKPDDETTLWEPYCSIIRSDLTLFENQLPYFLLEDLFNFINVNNSICQNSFFNLSARYFRDFLKEKDQRLSESVKDEEKAGLQNSDHKVKHFLDLILNSQRPSVKVEEEAGLQNSGNQVKHFLDLILNCWRPSESVKNDNKDRKPIHLPSANELHEFGVEFKKGESNCYLDIKSNKNGVLEIPVLDVTDYTEHIFRNMIAMEQCQVSYTDSYITHYIMLLDFLINTPKDVALLRRKKIINNYLGSDEAVAELINKLGTGVIVDTTESPYYEHLNNMSVFYNKRRNKWKAILKGIYLQNPWTITSLIVALVLLVCTVLQTVFSILSVVT